MSERALIVAGLKRALRERGLNYASVARALNVSLATVKRLFARGELSLQRVEVICELVGLSLREILERAQEHTAPTNQLTLTQEREIVADPRLFLVTWLVLNRVPFEEIVRSYRMTEREVLRYFIFLGAGAAAAEPRAPAGEPAIQLAGWRPRAALHPR
jgi:hypothetical protein